MMIRYYPFLFSDKSSHLFAPSILGTTFVVTMIIVLYTINSSTKRTLRIGSFDLLKGFLDAWINFNPTRLERLLEDHSKESSATTHFIDFSTAESKVALVVPEVHPGPFAPIGSYDLPGRLSWLLKSQGYKDCFVLHGAVDHSLNLLSAREVESYLSQLAAQSKESLFSNKISTPLSKESGKSVVTGIKIGDSLCLLVSIPTGSEDYPASFRESVKNLCAKIGYRKTILIDAHNAIGEDPSPELQEEVLRGVKTVASELFTAQQFTFSLNHSSKSYVFKSNDEADVGAAGLGCLILSIDDKRYALVYADSNNSALGLRDEIKKTLNDKGIFLLEFCTSDSHFNAARIRNKRGYLVLGESTPPQKIVDDVASMVDEATSLLHEASANVCQTVSRIRLAEDNLLESFEKAITESVHLTLWGLAIILSSLIIESVLLMTVT
jgi:putative membrane protein